MVVRTLEEEFNIYREVDGDSLPLRSHDRCNGRQSNGREGKKVSYKSLQVGPSRTESLL